MKTFSNQYNLRVNNQLRMISLLKKGKQSINYLAEHLDLSFTAASNVVEQLISYGVLTKVPYKPKGKTRGRVPVLVKIDTSKGLTCTIDLSSQDLQVYLNDLEGKEVVSKKIKDVTFIKEEHLFDIAVIIRELLNTSEANGRPLLSICIASPGLVHKNTGIIEESYRVSASKTVSPINFFFNEFGVPSYLYNDVKIACLGELNEGLLPKDARNLLYVHLGGSVGTALVIDGKIYQGKHGFSGEFSNYNEANDGFNYSNNRLYGLTQICQKLKELDSSLDINDKAFTIRYDLLVEEYKKRNPSLLQAIDEVAKHNALQLIAYNDFLDLDYIVFEGPILLLKEYFRESLNKHIRLLDSKEFRTKIIFSTLNENSSAIGATYQANNMYFLNKIEQMTNQRSTRGKYDISEEFGDDI